jgi:C-terminal processing protease CtpA/Prc
MKDKYSTFINVERMSSRMQRITGRIPEIGVGITFQRGLLLKKVPASFVEFPQSPELNWFIETILDSKYLRMTKKKSVQAWVFAVTYAYASFTKQTYLLRWVPGLALALSGGSWLHNAMVQKYYPLLIKHDSRVVLARETAHVLSANSSLESPPVLLNIEQQYMDQQAETDYLDVYAGDRILAVNNISVEKLSNRKIRKLLGNTGTVGDTVSITLQQQEAAGQQRPTSSGAGISGIADAGVELHRRTHIVTLMKVQAVKSSIDHRLLAANCRASTTSSAVGYIKVNEFTDETFDEISTALASMQRSVGAVKAENEKVKSHEAQFSADGLLGHLVLDLRGSPGGTLISALDVAALFLPAGAILSRITGPSVRPSTAGGALRHWVQRIAWASQHLGRCRYSDSDAGSVSASASVATSAPDYVEKVLSTNRQPDTVTPILCLVDGETASASEILVEALCDNGRAVSMGEQTTGKNLAQVRHLCLSQCLNFLVF